MRDGMIKSGSRTCVATWNEVTTDQPEFAHTIHLRGMVKRGSRV